MRIAFNYEKPSRKGSELSKKEQLYVLRAFIHRFTGDHKPEWANTPRSDGRPYPLQFKNDREWLENTSFQTTKGGKLSYSCDECRSNETWPHDPDLRKLQSV